MAANNRDYLPLALEVIAGAEQRLHVIEFVVYPDGTVQEILDALSAAAERGVEVRMLADEASDSTRRALEILHLSGIEARFDSPRRVTHNKLIIADDRVLLGSTNLTSNALDRNNEANIYVIDATVAAYFEEYFHALWADSATEPSVVWSRDSLLVPLSDRDIASAYLSCLEQASERILVLQYVVRYDESYPGSSYNRLVEALIEAHRDGIEVQVVLDASDWITEHQINDRAQDLLLAEGIPLRNPPASIVTHAKLLICDDTVIVSDANWAYKALEHYHGTSVQVTDLEVADQYRRYFQRIWDQGAPR